MHNITRDWWCERRMWRGMGVDTRGFSEPISALTGLVICVLVLIPNTKEDRQLPSLFVFVKSCLLFLGIGTAIFHAVEVEASRDAYLNLNIFDWLPLVLACASLLVMYLLPATKGLPNAELFAAYLLGLFWFLILVAGMDSVTYEQLDGMVDWGSLLNMFLLVPLLVTLLYYTVTVLKEQSLVLWYLLLASLVLWIVNYYLCPYWYPLALLHAVYHVVIAVALVEASCLGLVVGGEYEVDQESRWWPMVKSKVNPLKITRYFYFTQR